MQYMKLSTSRDFRINAATLDAALQEQEEGDVQQDGNDDDAQVNVSGRNPLWTERRLGGVIGGRKRPEQSWRDTHKI